MASCPSCGFDLTSEGRCPVCGSRDSVRRGASPKAALLLAGAAAALVGGVALALFGLGGLGRGGAQMPGRTGRTVGSAPMADRSALAAAPAESRSVLDPPAPAARRLAGDPSTDAQPSATTLGREAPSQPSRPPLTSMEAYVAWMQAHYPDQQAELLRARWERAKIAVERGHIRHEKLLVALLLTPREWFVRAGNLSRSYENAAMPIGYGQTISGPDLVARMTDYLNIEPHLRVLEIGTGSGYQSALLSQLTDNVYTIEIVKPLAAETDAIYTSHTPEVAAYAHIHRRTADGYFGWPEHAPYDRIMVTCGIDHIPPELLKELTPGGIMVIPVGPPSGQTILKITKQVEADGKVSLTREDIYHGMAKDIFVPFTADGGKLHSLNTNLTP